MNHRILLTGLLFCYTFFCTAQDGRDNLPPSYFFGAESANVPIVTTPRVNVEQLLSEDAVNAQFDQPRRFAVGYAANYNLNNSGRWDDLPDGGRMWRLAIRCPNALSINLLYDEFDLPEGVEYYVYQADYSQVLGKFTHRNTRPNRKFATALINESLLVVELYEPRKLVGRSRLSIGQINHGYRSLENLNTNGGGSGSCQVDVNCSPEGDDWQTEKKSVARYLIEGTRVCTGTLVNNTAEDGRQLFLTAYHCVDELDAITDPDASHFVFYWNFERENCDTGGSNNTATTTGATLLANHNNSDFALFELHENPRVVADVHYAGWDATGNITSGGVCIHHPGGDFKKIATHSLQPAPDNWLNTRPPTSHLKVQPWNATPNGHSVTQSGSSGAPLFDSQSRLIGQLHGGANIDCNNPSQDPGIFGALHYSWNNANASSPQRRLRDWLDPVGGGATTVLDGKSDFPPAISFAENELFIVEEMTTTGRYCNTYANYNVRLEIGSVPSEPITINLVTSGTAVKDTDFTISPESFVLTPTKRFQDITLRIYDDALVELAESVVIDYQIDGPSGNAVTGTDNQRFTATVESNDIPPTAAQFTSIIFQEDFENGLGGFTTTPADTTGFSTGNVATANSDYWEILPEKNATEFAFVNDDHCNCNMFDVLLISPNFDFSATTNASLSFDYAFSGEDYEAFELLVSTDNGQNWSPPVATLTNKSEYQGAGNGYKTDWVENRTIDLSSYNNVASLRFAFRYSDGNAWAFGTAIDNVRLLTTTTQSSTSVQMAVNSAAPAYANIPAFSEVHFYDPTSRHIIATVENDSDHDFGCTTLEVDRAGASATYPFASDTTRKEIFSKTYKFSPQYQSATADFILTTYHQSEEIAAWQTTAQQINNDSLRVIQVADDQKIADINPANATFFNIKQQAAEVSNLGEDLKISSGHFGGLSAFGFGLEQYINSDNSNALPLSLLYFKGTVTDAGNLIRWAVTDATAVETVQLERSTDGVQFAAIATYSTQQTQDEQFLDRQVSAGQTYFYRLASTSAGSTKVVSPMIQLHFSKPTTDVQIHPNPFREQVEIYTEWDEQIEVYNTYGKLIRRIPTAQQSSTEINTSDWEAGIYILKSQRQVVRIVKL